MGMIEFFIIIRKNILTIPISSLFRSINIFIPILLYCFLIGCSSIKQVKSFSKAPLPPLRASLTPEVLKEISYIRLYNPEYIQQSYLQKEKYYEMCSNIFEEEGVPKELINLGVIESNFNPQSMSPAGARGIWQFMPITAKEYGLMSWYNDKRTHPAASTEAAAKHLRKLYMKFQDWLLAIAAYNGGETHIVKALQKAGTSNFWALSRGGYLKKETAHYVPKFLAVTYLFSNALIVTEE
jgi:membrane-bound lytic murein transglycosylase D